MHCGGKQLSEFYIWLSAPTSAVDPPHHSDGRGVSLLSPSCVSWLFVRSQALNTIGVGRQSPLLSAGPPLPSPGASNLAASTPVTGLEGAARHVSGLRSIRLGVRRRSRCISPTVGRRCSAQRSTAQQRAGSMTIPRMRRRCRNRRSCTSHPGRTCCCWSPPAGVELPLPGPEMPCTCVTSTQKLCPWPPGLLRASQLILKDGVSGILVSVCCLVVNSVRCACVLPAVSGLALAVPDNNTRHTKKL